MNDIPGPLFFLVALVGLIVVLMFFLRQRGVSSAMLEALALQRKGRYEPGGGTYEFDQVIFPLSGTTALLHFSTRNNGIQYWNEFGEWRRPRNTHLTIYFPDPQLRLEMYSGGIVHHFRKLLGMYDIEIGVPAFDDAFFITGNNPDLIREYLGVAARSAIGELAKFGTWFSPDLQLSIGGGKLRITKHASLRSAAELMRFVALAEIMFRSLAYGRSPDIEFVSPRPQLTPAAVCRVCGDQLAGCIVTCQSCQTPHHLDCWQYFGSCSVYGCGQKRYLANKW